MTHPDSSDDAAFDTALTNLLQAWQPPAAHPEAIARILARAEQLPQIAPAADNQHPGRTAWRRSILWLAACSALAVAVIGTSAHYRRPPVQPVADVMDENALALVFSDDTGNPQESL